MSELLLTLGHNSSAILVDDGEIVCGYENERITKIKSDSQMPIQAIMECMKYAKTDLENIYVTHWEPTCSLRDAKLKHWNMSLLPKDVPIYTLSTDFTHHDAHAVAAAHFAGPQFPRHDTYVLVVDGFGNFGEHFSIYKMQEDGSLKLKKRAWGYDTSLGLFYQYTTAFLGLKMNQDEYKLLGYEAHIAEINVDLPALIKDAHNFAEDMASKIILSQLVISDTDPLINVAALPEIQAYYIKYYKKFMDKHALHRPDDFEARVAISYFAQLVTELVISHVINMYNPENVILTGGVFYNVKLNFTVIERVPGKVCINPLAGDQGNALGLYQSMTGNLQQINDLCWGIRDLSNVPTIENLHSMDGWAAIRQIKSCLDAYGYVNVVRGAMEFGPRALCHTTTLAIASPEYVARINTANGRNTIMPMAPVMSRETYNVFFENSHKVWKSEEFMITALKYHDSIAPYFAGAAHCYGNMCTGRPQVTDDPFILEILEDYTLLINTSFNIHGHPIVFGVDQVVENHVGQLKIDPSFNTVIVQGA